MGETKNIPQHVAIVMDGNGRWAQSRGKERLYGHVQGVESVREVIKAARKHGVKYLTLYAFSTENWDRPQSEVDGLMEILCESVVNEMDMLRENGVKVEIIGDRTVMPIRVQEHLKLIENQTKQQSKLTVVLALNYGAREEITYAVKSIAQQVSEGLITTEQIDVEMVGSKLYTANTPDPDLLIRPGGERRLSNFLLWQMPYTELYFTDIHWPDFGQQEFAEALADYAKRERRYGRITKTDISRDEK